VLRSGRTRAVAAAVALLLVVVPAGGASDGSPAVARLTGLGLPLFCGGPNGRAVALTFDDGPGPYTALVLRLLRRAGARATFFLVGKELARWPDMPKRELRLGALGDHTWSHLMLTLLNAGVVRRELASTKLAIERKTHAPVQLFRPPYGAHNRTVDTVARSLGLLEVLWSIDSRDSEGAPWYQIACTQSAFPNSCASIRRAESSSPPGVPGVFGRSPAAGSGPREWATEASRDGQRDGCLRAQAARAQFLTTTTIDLDPT